MKRRVRSAIEMQIKRMDTPRIPACTIVLRKAFALMSSTYTPVPYHQSNGSK